MTSGLILRLAAFAWVLTGLALPFAGYSQTDPLVTDPDRPVYYIGINPVAPFAGIRGAFTRGYLPAFSNCEAGASVFVGKIWNRNYNVETRVSFGNPRNSATLFLVQSGFNYRFLSTKKNWRPYAGVFFKIYSLHDGLSKYDHASIISYACAGNRFIRKRFFADIRINQNLLGLSWSTDPNIETHMGFHRSLYKWKSAYVPFAGIGVGLFL